MNPGCRFFQLLILILFPLIARSQGQFEDVVYLKNGNIFRGEILDEKEGEFIRLRTWARNEMIFQFEEIEKVTKEEIPREYRKRNHELKDKGNFNTLGIGISLGYSYGLVGGMNLEMHNGYMLNRNLSLGVTSGLDAGNNSLWYVMGEGRYYLDRGLFLRAGAGYDRPIVNREYYTDINGGVSAMLGGGTRVPMGGNTALIIQLNYRMYKFKTENAWWGGSTIEKMTFFRGVLGLGIQF